MRSAPDAVKAFLATTNVCWRADLITITLSSGSVLYWTTADVALGYGGHTFVSGPVISRRLRQALFPEIDTLSLELAGTFQIGGVALSKQAANGYFDDARVSIDHAIGAYPGDLSRGVVSAWFAGRISGVDPTPTRVAMTAKSDVEYLSTVQVPRHIYRSQCNNTVYDAVCGVSRAAFTQTGTVTGTPTASAFNLSITGKPDHYFNLGVIAFTSGANAGVRRSIREYASAGSLLTPAIPLPTAPAAGDSFSIYPGCSRTWLSCNQVFSNSAAFRGFAHVPSPEGGT